MSYYSMAYPIDNVNEARQQIDTNADDARRVLFEKAQTEWEMLPENQECLRYIEFCNDVNRSDGTCNDFFYYDTTHGTFRKCVESKKIGKYCGSGENKSVNTCPLEEIYIRIQEGQIEFEKEVDELLANFHAALNNRGDLSKIEQPHPYVILEIAENVAKKYNIPPQTIVTSIKVQEAMQALDLRYNELNNVIKPRRSKKKSLKSISRAFDKASRKASRKASSTAYGSAFGIGGRKRKSKKHKKRKTKRK